MKRVVFSFLLVCILVWTLPACSSGDSSSDDDDSVDGDEATDDDDDTPVDGDDELPDEDGDAPWEEDPNLPERLVDRVDPFIGTGGQGFNVGSGLPGATVPFGMIKVSPQNAPADWGTPAKFYNCSGYWYDYEAIYGFGQLHISGTGTPDYGVLVFQPQLGMDEDRTDEQLYKQVYDKETEEAHPGYYHVTYPESGITTELTATQRSSLMRFSYPADSDAVVLFDLAKTLDGQEIVDSTYELDADARELKGMIDFDGSMTGRDGTLKIYFFGRFDTDIVASGAFQDGVLQDGATSGSGTELGCYFHMDLPESKQVQLQVGISYVSVEQAKKNLDAEQSGFDFEGLRGQAEELWQSHLERVRISGGSLEEQTTFYTAMYHVFMAPTRFQDVDGQYMAFDKQVHQTEDFVYYTDFSLWDTFRTLHPILVLIAPEEETDMVKSLLDMKEKGGTLPRWPIGASYSGAMIGSHADAVISDTYVKGLTDFDADFALEAMVQTADNTVPEEARFKGRSGMEHYLNYGYVPADLVGSSASKTLEYVYNDWNVAMMAQALGETEIAERMLERSKNYALIWDDETAFFRGMNSDGSFVDADDDFNPNVWKDYYTEANAWQYLWFVPHDPLGLAVLFGGVDAMLEKLNYFFEQSELEQQEEDLTGGLLPPIYYWQGNEPDIHAATLFNELGRPDLAQKWMRWIAETHFNATPAGIPGNDDCGTMSAWYVFGALGLFPLPGKDIYYLHAPIFPDTVVDLGNGRTLQIQAPAATSENIYIQAVRFNGEEIHEPWIKHTTLAEGGTLEFDLVSQPTEWAFFTPQLPTR